MRYLAVGSVVLLSGCLGLGLRSDLDREPQPAEIVQTEVELRSALPGARATLGSMDVVLVDGSVHGVVVPPLGIDVFVLDVERDGAGVVLDHSLEPHYRFAGIEDDALVAAMTLVVVRLPDGACALATPDGVAGERIWAGDPDPIPEPCGPWDTR